QEEDAPCPAVAIASVSTRRCRIACTPRYTRYPAPRSFTIVNSTADCATTAPSPTETRSTSGRPPSSLPSTLISPPRRPSARERPMTNSTLGPGTTISTNDITANATSACISGIYFSSTSPRPARLLRCGGAVISRARRPGVRCHSPSVFFRTVRHRCQEPFEGEDLLGVELLQKPVPILHEGSVHPPEDFLPLRSQLDQDLPAVRRRRPTTHEPATGQAIDQRGRRRRPQPNSLRQLAR